MSITTLSGLRICGIASAVPSTPNGPTCDMSETEVMDTARMQKMTGIVSRRIAGVGICTSDLCGRAATAILKELQWDPKSIDALIFVSQTGDYILPATSCKLHAVLGLDKKCAAFDVGLGCSGYIYGLWLSGLMITSGYRRVLLLAGDTVSRLISSDDRATRSIFGDAGTATAIERCVDSSQWTFELGTDGNGASNLIVPSGGMREAANYETLAKIELNKTIGRKATYIQMNGPEVFAFTIREIPSLVLNVLKIAQWDISQVDYFIFHQANMFMLNHLADNLSVPKSKMPSSLSAFGNTSSASIPLTISHQLKNCLSKQINKRIVMTGFGVGYSWGAVAMQIGSLALPDVIEYS